MENDRKSVKSNRTSPYLQKPIRSLDEVHAERQAADRWRREVEAGKRLDNDTFRSLRTARG